jgi:glyoxylase I family protein
LFKRIDHVEIVTDNMERTIDFYTTVLGFTVKSKERVPASPLGVPMNIVYVQLGDTVMEVICYDGASPEPAPQKEHLGYRIMALEVDDMQTAIDFLKTKGVEPVWGPKPIPNASRAEIHDCNGNVIELRQWLR